MESVKNSVAEKKKVTIEVVTDYICPWCYIGKQRLDNALDTVKDEYDAEIVFVPFELNADMPGEGQNRKEYRSAKFGSWEKSQAMDRQVATAGRQLGLTFDYDKVLVTPNTFKAHLLTQYAQAVGKHRETSRAIFKAYFTDGRNIGLDDVLLDIAREVGLDIETVETVLRSATDRAALRKLEQAQAERGVNSVPLFIVGNRAVSGAQREEVLVDFIKENAAKHEA